MSEWNDDYRKPITAEQLKADLHKLSDPEMLPVEIRERARAQREYERVVGELDLSDMIDEYIWNEAHAEYEARRNR